MLAAGSLPAPLPEPEPASALVTGVTDTGVARAGAARAVPSRFPGRRVAARATVSAIDASRPMRKRRPRGTGATATTTCSFVWESLVTFRVSEHPWRLLTHAERKAHSLPICLVEGIGPCDGE